MAPSHHGTCVVIGNKGVLIRGASGSGKSGLAFELIQRERTAGRFACLVADDQVYIDAINGRLVARCPEPTRGLMELRGHGIVKMPHLNRAVLRLIIDIEGLSHIERLPESHELETEVLGIKVRRQPVPLESFDASVRLAYAALRTL
ncbi:HPr kinase/phosphatase C-terminal domain-containing protein [Pseudovibrio sp. SPO723]|uniref:HPr kinase/phosphorylase n=1 Tax=Nesiotobacter zosterae TaxID=392721 RepID=UPI0029C2CBD0|nr:HPr kinase/phosphatase C-terminal domain-containing protein [Pseudovibrio sp. SPO723]MDX5592113.1 HPr kinase/phosphatase C-terminal domain-containing protein [Pseudovibrio sp. SPO723]